MFYNPWDKNDRLSFHAGDSIPKDKIIMFNRQERQVKFRINPMVFSHQIIDSNNQLMLYKESDYITLRRSIDIFESILHDDKRLLFTELDDPLICSDRDNGISRNLFLKSESLYVHKDYDNILKIC